MHTITCDDSISLPSNGAKRTLSVVFLSKYKVSVTYNNCIYILLHYHLREIQVALPG